MIEVFFIFSSVFLIQSALILSVFQSLKRSIRECIKSKVERKKNTLKHNNKKVDTNTLESFDTNIYRFLIKKK